MEFGELTAVCEHGEVVPCDITETQDCIFPPIFDYDVLAPPFKPVLVQGEAGVDQIEQHIVPNDLKSWDRERLLRQKRRESILRGQGNGKDLSVVACEIPC